MKETDRKTDKKVYLLIVGCTNSDGNHKMHCISHIPTTQNGIEAGRLDCCTLHNRTNPTPGLGLNTLWKALDVRKKYGRGVYIVIEGC